MSQLNHSLNSKSSTTKNNFLRIIDILIVIIFIFFILYVFLINQVDLIKWIVGILIVFCALIYAIIFNYSRTKEREAATTVIEKLILLNDRSLGTKEWTLKGETSLLIGKKSVDGDVDIDLTGTEFESLVNNQHAVLNYVSGVWYIEDIDSFSGIGIKKAGKLGAQRLQNGEPNPVRSGDILYIGNTKLLVK